MPLLFDLAHTDHLRRAAMADFASAAAPTHYPPDLGLEPVALLIRLNVDIDAAEVKGEVEHTLVARRAGVREITLDAVGLEDVEISDADGRPTSMSYDGETLIARWEESFESGESRRLKIAYRVTKPAAGLYFSKPSEQYPTAGYWAGTDHETERARHWLPTIDHPAVRPTLEFHLTAREDLTILANGAFVSETLNENATKTSVWKLDYGCPSYLTCFAIGEFSEFDDGEFEGRPLKYYAEKDVDPSCLELSFGRTGAMLEWMTKRLGADFPFPKYFQFALPQIGGAMENISLVSWDSIFVLDETFAKEWTWLLDQINVHEMAHSYFGDAIVCRDFAHAWLKESWATYIESCWLEDSKGEDEKLYDLYRNAHAYFDEADNNYKRPLVTRKFDSSWDMYDRHLYPGGACRLHTLRSELGDEIFWPAVSDYVNTYSGDVVETDDFRRIMEKHSGRSLGEFFDQWIHTADYPHLEVSYAWDDDANEVKLTVEQKQASGDEKGHVFKLKLGVALGFDGETQLESMTLEQNRQVFTFRAASEPAWVQIDPEWTSLHKLDFDPGSKMLQALLKSGNSLGRIHAAKTLAKKPRPAGIAAIAQAYDAEEFWGCKEQYVEALAAAGTSEAIEVLARLVTEETDGMVLPKIMAKAGAFKDSRLADALSARLEKGDLPYWSEHHALASLGKIGDVEVGPLRKRALEGGWQGVVGAGACRALESVRNDEALVALLDIADQPGMPWRVRTAAAAGAGRLASFLEKPSRKRAEEELLERLRDEDIDVAKAAVDGLVALGATGAIGRIESFARTRSHQETVGLRRKVAALRGNAAKPVAALEKEIEDMRSTLRDLQKRLTELEGAKS